MTSRYFLLFGSLLTAISMVSAEGTGMACDDYFVNIDNTTDLSFYSSCPILDFMVGPSHNFSGAFDLPGVQSIGKFSSGYFGPKFTGSTRVEDGVTTVSMPDLVNTTAGGVLFGYLNNLTSVDFRKLETINGGDIAIIGNYELRDIALPSLANVTGGALFDGPFDSISLPALKTISYLIVKSTGDLDCIALGKNLSSLTFTPQEGDFSVGFTCWTSDEKNTYNSSDVNSGSGSGASTSSRSGNASPTVTGSTAAGTSKVASEAGSRVKMRCINTMVALVSLVGFVGLML
ncbi:hypothetical protein IFR05_014746 [Cadophora sp. M221]|nr:hypothetical protein IFR05_014746 [Cadophora sp. M221]